MLSLLRKYPNIYKSIYTHSILVTIALGASVFPYLLHYVPVNTTTLTLGGLAAGSTRTLTSTWTSTT